VNDVHNSGPFLQSLHDIVGSLQGNRDVLLGVPLGICKTKNHKDDRRIVGKLLDLRQFELFLKGGDFGRADGCLPWRTES
jgi:hypothetical protein